MKVSIFGSGYVGLSTGACLAEAGNHVLCVDVDPDKVAALNRGEVAIYEPGLDVMVRENRAAGRLRFTTDGAEGVGFGEFQFIAVGTPTGGDGGADLGQVRRVAGLIGEHLASEALIINKSTVPVGSADEVRGIITEALSRRGASVRFEVVSNPEFLKEGSAVKDFLKPDRVIIGTDSPAAAERMKALYAPFNRNHDRILVMDSRSAELAKYAANAMLASRISFMNEIAGLAERLHADVEEVRRGIGSDPRIGYAFLYAGLGYGGSCLPKDVRALRHTARGVGFEPLVIDAVERVNERQKTCLFEMVRDYFAGELAGRRLAVWGLAFKPNTTDMREAPSVPLVRALNEAGARVRGFDPEASAVARGVFDGLANVSIEDDSYAAVEDADALLVVTEWRSFWSPDLQRLKALMRAPVIFDGRNIYSPKRLAEAGFIHLGIGRARASTD